MQPFTVILVLRGARRLAEAQKVIFPSRKAKVRAFCMRGAQFHLKAPKSILIHI